MELELICVCVIVLVKGQWCDGVGGGVVVQ